MAITDTKKDLKLGEAVDTLLQNADDNFTSLFDTVDDLNEAIPTKTSELTNDSGFISGENGKAADSAKLDGKVGSYYLNFNNLTNKPTKLSDFTNDGGFINKDVDDLTNYTVKDETGTDIEVLLNSTDQKLTISLKNIDGTVISSKAVDFPIEQLVMSVEYVEADKDLKITLQNGTVTRVPLDAIIDGLVSNTRKINGKALSSDITLTQDDIASGSTYKRVKSGGDVTIDANGVITVASIGGKTADEIGMVKDVQVNGTSVLDPDSGVANISIAIDDLGSEFTEVTASASKAINGTTYYGFNIANATEDVSLEVYNSSGQQIVVQKVRNTTNNTIFVACSTTSGGTYSVRSIGGNGIGSDGDTFTIAPIVSAWQTSIDEGGYEYTLDITNPNPFPLTVYVDCTDEFDAGGHIKGHYTIDSNGIKELLARTNVSEVDDSAIKVYYERCYSGVIKTSW